MIRRTLLFAASLIALLGSLTATGATIVERNFQLRGYVDATQEINLPFRVPRLGINAELTQYSPAQLNQHLDLMQQAHVTWVRQFVRWDEIERQPGVHNWSTWDEIVDAVAQYPDLKLVAVLVNTPDWARDGTSITAPPDDPTDFGAFAGAFARRYGHSIDYYQVWDEPNLTEAWGGSHPRPAHYMALLQSAYQQIHSADPGAMVIAAGLAPTVEQGPQNISDWRYLNDLYALGADHYFDAVAGKPYGFDVSPQDRTVNERVLNFSRVVGLREVMIAHGDGQKSLWASNWGWNSLPDDWMGEPSLWGQVSQTEQIEFTLQALDRADHEWPWLGGMILHHWQPDAPVDDPSWGFALINQDSEPSALWQALTSRTPSSAAGNGHHPAANRYATYSGVWTFGDLGADIGWINDSQFQFTFEGRDVALLLRQDNYVAYLYPTVDGERPNALPVDAAGNAYVVLTSDSLEPSLDLVPVARDLPPGQHTLSVIADDLVPDEAQDRWALVGYAVSSGNLKTPYDRQLTVAAITVIIAAVAVIGTGRNIAWATVRRVFTTLWDRLDNAGQLIVSAVTSVALMIGMLLTWGDATPALFRREPVQLGLAMITAGLAYIQPGLLLTLAALIGLFVIVYNRIELGMALTLLWSPFFLFPVELFRFAFPMAEITILVTTIAASLRLLRDWGLHRQTAVSQFPVRLKFNFTGLDLAVLMWLVLGVLSLFWAEIRSNAVTELRVLILEPALFYVIVRIYGRRKKTLVLLVDALLLAGFLVAVIGLWLFFVDQAVITAEGGARRLVSVYGSPNNVGLFLGRCLPFALAFLLISIDRTRRIAAGIIILPILLALVLSQSAGAIFLGVPFATATVILLARRRRALLPLVGLGAVAVASFAIALRSARFARLLDFSSGTNFVRIRVWQSAINIIQDYPLTGIGLDQFLYAFQGRYILPDAWQEPNLSHPHNFILDFWIRLGLMGVLVFIWIQALFWKTMFRVYSLVWQRDPILLALAVGVMGCMVNLLAHGLVDNSVFVHDLAYVFVFILALSQNLTNMRAIDAQNKIMV